MSIKIGSWNLRNLSKKRTDNCIQRLAEIFKTFDLLAIQEVRDELIIKKICDQSDMLYSVSTPVGKGQKRKELYAFVYKEHVKLLSEALLPAEKDFVRSPYMGFFSLASF